MVRLSVDFEHDSRQWWDSGGTELWEAITGGDGANAVVLDDSLAESWIAQARTVAGWDAGHEFAPHPIAMQAVADDDPDL